MEAQQRSRPILIDAEFVRRVSGRNEYLTTYAIDMVCDKMLVNGEGAKAVAKMMLKLTGHVAMSIDDFVRIANISTENLHAEGNGRMA